MACWLRLLTQAPVDISSVSTSSNEICLIVVWRHLARCQQLAKRPERHACQLTPCQSTNGAGCTGKRRVPPWPHLASALQNPKCLDRSLTVVRSLSHAYNEHACVATCSPGSKYSSIIPIHDLANQRQSSASQVPLSHSAARLLPTRLDNQTPTFGQLAAVSLHQGGKCQMRTDQAGARIPAD